MYMVSFQNRVKIVDTIWDAWALRSRWGGGHSRKYMDRHFHINQL